MFAALASSPCSCRAVWLSPQSCTAPNVACFHAESTSDTYAEIGTEDGGPGAEAGAPSLRARACCVRARACCVRALCACMLRACALCVRARSGYPARAGGTPLLPLRERQGRALRGRTLLASFRLRTAITVCSYVICGVAFLPSTIMSI